MASALASLLTPGWASPPLLRTLAYMEAFRTFGTGRIGLGRFFAPELPRPNDGVVSVEETRVPGMRDHVVVPASHTAMLVSAEVARHICVFLDSGKFVRADTVQA